MENVSANVAFKPEQEMIAFLLRKGYDGQFMFQCDAPAIFTTGTVEHSLQKLLTSCHTHQFKMAHARLTTDFYQDDKSEPWFCRILLDYKQHVGFRIAGMKFYRTGQTREMDIPIKNNDDLPSFKSLSGIVVPLPRWKKHIRRVLGAFKLKK